MNRMTFVYELNSNVVLGFKFLSKNNRTKCSIAWKYLEIIGGGLANNFTSSGVYTINPDGGKPMQVLCDMVTDGGGWAVFQKRLDGSVDFFLGWNRTKMVLEIWTGVLAWKRQHLPFDICWWRHAEGWFGGSDTLNTRLLRLQMKEISTGFWLEDTMVQLVTRFHIISKMLRSETNVYLCCML